MLSISQDKESGSCLFAISKTTGTHFSTILSEPDPFTFHFSMHNKTFCYLIINDDAQNAPRPFFLVRSFLVVCRLFSFASK